MNSPNPSAGPRQLLFFISPRPIDFDSFLPTIMELKDRRPEWEFKVVCFDPNNFEMIQKNPVLLSGLNKAATFHYCGNRSETNGGRRWLTSIRNFLWVAGWILRHANPALFLAVPFADFPYRAWHFLARLRGGKGYILFKHRSPDEMHHLMWRTRAQRGPRAKSPWSRMFGSDQDGILYYHDFQERMISDLAQLGWIEDAPCHKIGLPHLFPAWQRHIEDEVEIQRRQLVADGVPADTELFGFFPSKPGSNELLRGDDSVEWVFVQQMTALSKARPDGFVLLRPHPLAVDEAYVREGIEAFGQDRARISYAHPEVLLRLCHRCFFNNPTNLLFHCFPGRMVDCSDYPDYHFEERGETSMADGLGVVYIRPDDAKFDTRFEEILESEEPFQESETCWRLSEMLESGHPNIDALLAILEPKSSRATIGQPQLKLGNH